MPFLIGRHFFCLKSILMIFVYFQDFLFFGTFPASLLLSVTSLTRSATSLVRSAASLTHSATFLMRSAGGKHQRSGGRE